MKKLIPPYLLLFCIGLTIGLYFVFPGTLAIPIPFNLFGIVFILTGILLLTKARMLIEKHDTEIHTFKKPRTMISEGPFLYSRNPIYAAFTIMLIGVWMMIGNWYSIIGWILFFLCANYWYIPFEEKNLEKEFGKAYLDYKSKVRRWI